DQSLMTGESEPTRKSVRPDEDESDGPDHSGCVYRGTQVVDGIGAMVVTNVGDDTMLGQIARRLSGDTPEQADEIATDSSARVQRKLTIAKDFTPLQHKLTDRARLVSRVGYIAAVAIFLALLFRGTFLAVPREVYLPSNAAES